MSADGIVIPRLRRAADFLDRLEGGEPRRCGHGETAPERSGDPA